MTLRRIEPVDMEGAETPPPRTGPPIIEWFDPRDPRLVVDETYQRAISQKGIRQSRKIAADWDWSSFNAPTGVLGEDEDGAAVVKLVNGQHTVAAAAANPHVAQIPILIVEVPEVRSQAKGFLGHNRDRLIASPGELHYAAVTAGEAKAGRLQALCERVGIRILKTSPGGGNFKPGDTLSVSVISEIIASRTDEEVEPVLRALVEGGLAPINARHLRAVASLFYDDEFEAMQPDKLGETIRHFGPGIQTLAKQFAETHKVKIWQGMRATWFKHVPKKRKAPTARLVVENPRYVGGIPEDLVPDTRAAKGDWRPGNFSLRCEHCDKRFRGHKNATSCAPCAYGSEKETAA